MVFHRVWPTIKVKAMIAPAKTQAATSASTSHVLLSIAHIIT